MQETSLWRSFNNHRCGNNKGFTLYIAGLVILCMMKYIDAIMLELMCQV